jgi:drug/metabolite transporter (DMT)-like permease
MQKTLATLIGVLALVFWSTAALVIVLIGKLPVFEMQAILCSISFLLGLLLFRKTLFTALEGLPISLLSMAIFGIFGTNIFYIWAFRYAMPEKVLLINYLWPLLAILFSFALKNEKIRLLPFLGMLLSFFGIYVLLGDELHRQSHAMSWLGYGLSFLSAICWAFFTVQIRKYPQMPLQIIAVGSGFAALFSWFLHGVFEVFILPSPKQMALLLLLGLTSQGLAIYAWYFGIKKGNEVLLFSLSYLVPIFSVIFLILFGHVLFHPKILYACLLVVGGVLIASNLKFRNSANTLK